MKMRIELRKRIFLNSRPFDAMASSLREHDDKIKNANQELEQANISLQKLNRNYLDMLGFVSHELKNSRESFTHPPGRWIRA